MSKVFFGELDEGFVAYSSSGGQNHSVRGIVFGDVVHQILTSDGLDVFTGSQNGASQRMTLGAPDRVAGERFTELYGLIETDKIPQDLAGQQYGWRRQSTAHGRPKRAAIAVDEMLRPWPPF